MRVEPNGFVSFEVRLVSGVLFGFGWDRLVSLVGRSVDQSNGRCLLIKLCKTEHENRISNRIFLSSHISRTFESTSCRVSKWKIFLRFGFRNKNTISNFKNSLFILHLGMDCRNRIECCRLYDGSEWSGTGKMVSTNQRLMSELCNC